jgi:DNA polymerase-3 subunit epsilon
MWYSAVIIITITNLIEMTSNHREVVIDTETTGLEPSKGHKIVEIAAVEIVGRVRTGKYFHRYVNPNRDMPDEAFRVHGISADFLKDKPTFPSITKEFLDFVGTSTMIIHNAAFDIAFINAELASLGINPITMRRVVDTLDLARRKFPGMPASLDALCKRFNISLKSRDKHGALIDSELLAMVYAELLGGMQKKLDLEQGNSDDHKASVNIDFPARAFAVSKQEIIDHEQMLQAIKNPLWKNFS